MAEVCARCGYREVEPNAREGWCSECVIQNTREKYGEKQRAATVSRREAWSERSSNAWDRDRQRVHRLKAAVKPREPAPFADPFEVAYEALRELDGLKPSIRQAEQRDRLEVVAEAIRRLAYGPDDEPAKAEPTKAALEARARRARKAAEPQSHDPKPSGWSDWQQGRGKAS